MNKIQIKRFFPEEWDTLKEGIMKVERDCFPPELYMSEEYTKESMCDENCYAYLALVDGEIVGNTYGNLLSSVDEDWFEGHWNPESYKHYDKKTLYVTSTGVLKDYRNLGIANSMKYSMLKDCKKNGFEYVIGHSHAGTMTEMNKFYGGKIIQEFPNWFGSEWSNYLYEIDLSKLPILLPVKHLKQLHDFDCAVAACAVLFNADKVINYGDSYIQFGVFPDKGTSHEGLIDFALTVYGFKLSSKYECQDYDIFNKINEGTKVIVNYQSEGEGHYSVIFGYDDSYFFLLDVWDGKEKKIGRQDFIESWYSKRYGSQWMCWVLSDGALNFNKGMEIIHAGEGKILHRMCNDGC